jgi:hypothetical protein
MMVPSDFDWHDDSAVVLREQPATAIYPNRNGAIVIRQEHPWDEDSDTIVILQPQNARRVANAILEVAALLANEATSETILEGNADEARATRQRQRGEQGVPAEQETHQESLPLLRAVE